MTPDAPASAVQHLVVSADEAEQRLDKYLARKLPGVPKSHLYRLIRTGQVRVNKGRADAARRLLDGDVVRIPPVREAAADAPMAPAGGLIEQLKAGVIASDADLLVLDKPSGLASHGGSGISHGVIEIARAAFTTTPLELAHRLDRETSGVLLLTRTRRALLAFQSAQARGDVDKRYLALLMGQPKRERFDVNAPLDVQTRVSGERTVTVSSAGKPALTRFCVLERYRGAFLVEAVLETGRTHQIRVHAAHHGHPLAGDERYGNAEFNAAMATLGLRRLFLHASRLGLKLPELDRDELYNAPLPEDLHELLAALQPA